MWFSLLSYPVLPETHSPHHPSFCNYCGNKKDNPVQTEFSGLVLNSLHTPAKMSTPGPQWFQTPALNQNGSPGLRKKKKKNAGHHVRDLIQLARGQAAAIAFLCSRVSQVFFFLSSFLFFLPSFLPSFLSFLLFRVPPAAYGSSQARGQIGAVTTGLHHSHSNTGSEPHLWSIPQLTATRNP